MTQPVDLRPEHDVLVRKLRSISPLSEQERQSLLSLPLSIKQIPADEVIVREGDRPFASCLLVEGFTCRYKFTEQGKRQIFSFHTPGDIPDLQSVHLTTMDHSLGTLTRCKVGFIPHESILKLTRSCPRIADVLWRDTLVDAAIFREWMIGIGRRPAYTRIAHLLCEVFVRLKAVDLTNGDQCDWPITQVEIGDALGLSNVHVNRSLQDLRADGLIELGGGSLTILDWQGLKKAGEFDLTYLHLNSGQESIA
jgi:CRP-like cAMP-binding protein